MAVDLRNAKPNDRVGAGTKARVTWRWTLGEYVSGAHFDVRKLDLSILQALPGMSFIPVTSPQAVPGDTVIVYDVRLNQSWGAGGKTWADVVAALDKFPTLQIVDGSWVATGAAVNVAVVTALPSSGVSSSDLNAGVALARDEGNASVASDRASTFGFLDTLKTFGTGALVLLTLGVVAFGVYTYRKV